MMKPHMGEALHRYEHNSKHQYMISKQALVI